MKKRAAKKAAKVVDTIGTPEVVGRDLGAGPAGLEKEDVVELEGAERAREEAFVFEPVWKLRDEDAGVPVVFSFSKEALFWELRKAMGAPDFSECWKGLESFTGDAARIVWLGIHAPVDYRDVRGNLMALQERIEEWLDEIPRELQYDLIGLAKQVWNAAQANVAEPTGDGRPQGSGPGN